MRPGWPPPESLPARGTASPNGMPSPYWLYSVSGPCARRCWSRSFTRARLSTPSCIVCALYQRMRTGRGQRVLCAMQDGVLNLARVKLRDQQRLAHGPLTEYRQYAEGLPFGKAVPRSGNDSGGGQPGWILKCKGWETDPDAYIYFITQAPVWEAI